MNTTISIFKEQDQIDMLNATQKSISAGPNSFTIDLGPGNDFRESAIDNSGENGSHIDNQPNINFGLPSNSNTDRPENTINIDIINYAPTDLHIDTIESENQSALPLNDQSSRSHVAKNLLLLLPENLNQPGINGNSSKLKLVAYVRKSVDDGRGNASLEDQKAVLGRWITDNNHTLHPRIFEEVASSGSQRAVFEEMLRFVCNPVNKVDGIIVFKLDRFGRSMAEVVGTVEELTIRRGKNLVCVADNVFRGPYFANEGNNLPFLLNCIVAEHERENIRRRTKTAKQERKRRGIGQSRFSPYGYRFSVVGADGVQNQSFDAGKLKVARATLVNSRLAVVAHFGEQQQINHLMKLAEKMRLEKGRLPTGSEMLIELRSKGCDINYRKLSSTEGDERLTNASNVKKNFVTCLKYITSIN